jgi:hypothetical protein
VDTANRSTAIVSSLFPEKIQQQLMEEACPQEKSALIGGKNDNAMISNKPIADLFPETTIMVSQKGRRKNVRRRFWFLSRVLCSILASVRRPCW